MGPKKSTPDEELRYQRQILTTWKETISELSELQLGGIYEDTKGLREKSRIVAKSHQKTLRRVRTSVNWEATSGVHSGGREFSYHQRIIIEKNVSTRKMTTQGNRQRHRKHGPPSHRTPRNTPQAKEGKWRVQYDTISHWAEPCGFQWSHASENNPMCLWLKLISSHSTQNIVSMMSTKRQTLKSELSISRSYTRTHVLSHLPYPLMSPSQIPVPVSVSLSAK